MMSEKTLHRAVCDYLRMAYPGVLFNSDLAGATKLSIGQAVSMKHLRSDRGWPDLFIADPGKRFKYHGLFIELKKEGTKLYKKDNMTPATPHILEQFELQILLQQRGYKCSFAVGFDEAKQIIDKYLSL
jgi:hypothetical protein